ncbi:MAG TPA: homoserine dehydrogenase [Dehalococcoidia bacterium]|nr:homoserine dehydrogenase [Dehalococcoidia bacterium]
MPAPSTLGIVLLGLGNVGAGVARALTDQSATYSERIGATLELRKVLVRDVAKQRAYVPDASLLTSDADEALATDCDIVVELMGGETPARDYIERSLRRGRWVVTGNKEVMAKYGPELLTIATEAGVDILNEASVGGGIPIISPLKRDLSANHLTSLQAIINGTTNYILTRMSREGAAFDDALAQAQALGYAEADPTNDVEGFDAAYKLAILASLAFHSQVRVEDIYREGITKLTPRDFRYAAELGYAIKLLAIGRRDHGGIQARVHPALVPSDELLAKVDGVLNAVQVEGDLIGRVLFQGAGAGSLPTTSAIMADVLDAARSIVLGSKPSPWRYTADIPMKPMSELETRYYIRVEVTDKPGVLAGIARAFGDNGVSIASVIQKETEEDSSAAELVIVTHTAKEAALQTAISQVEGLEGDVRKIGAIVRVEA